MIKRMNSIKDVIKEAAAIGLWKTCGYRGLVQHFNKDDWKEDNYV